MTIKLNENELKTLNEINQKLIKLYSDFEKVESYINDSASPGLEAIELASLAGGYAGIALALGVSDDVSSNQSTDEISYEYIKRCIAIIQSNPTYSFSLFSGLTGILISLKFNSKNGQRYKNIIEQLLQVITHNYKESLSISQANLINNTVTTDDFDVILGWSGILRTLLEFDNDLYDTELNKIIEDISLYLIKLGEFTNDSKPCWFIEYAQLSDIEKETFVGGFYNNGMSHGISGVLASLSILYIKGYRFNGLESSINNIRTWLLQNILEHRGVEYIPNVTVDNTNTNTNTFNHRDAWCYGTPGVSTALFISAMTDENLYIKEKSIELFKTFLKRASEEHKLISPTICHGFAGILMLCIRLIEYGVSDPEILEIANNVFQKLMSFYKENELILFPDYEIIENKRVEIHKIGLLEGVTGIFLIIQSLLHDKNEWDQIFLIS
ncbi:lanthionine synthetase C family protein [Bacillus thuringiensis]|uniref:lanthionine synthetase C family protein n=1 Tax=Bacillus thuringiensis TaxID=1428 RepID=UPI0021D66B58|nr:lanthionine synthetase C family protein [Bacillus thuringiensis]MCU7668079.1 lanthionine synthetase C family protein [Bacillus thuringiensis]